MFNFEHEIDNIKDRYLRNFFAWDYFHDGTIHNIDIIFSKFEIKKRLNDVIVPNKVSNRVLFGNVKRKFQNRKNYGGYHDGEKYKF